MPPEWAVSSGVSQILCKHRRAVKIEQKLFIGVVACPPPLEFNIGREMCACQGQRPGAAVHFPLDLRAILCQSGILSSKYTAIWAWIMLQS